MNSSPQFRLYDFKITNEISVKKKGSVKEFVIQMFAMNEKGETASIKVEQFEPFFYIKVGDNWTESTVSAFKVHIRRELARDDLEQKYKQWQKGKKAYPQPEADQSLREYIEQHYKTYKTYQFKGLCDMQLISRHKLYGFDNKKMHNFVAIKFKNTSALNKVKNMWYDRYPDATSHFGYTMHLKTVCFEECDIELYEAKLPPLLRFFHIQKISPSGWIQLPKRKFKSIKNKKNQL